MLFIFNRGCNVMRNNLALLYATHCATSWCSGEFWDLSHFQTARQSVKMSVFINYIYMNTRQLTLPMISLGCPCVILPTLDSTTSVVYNHRLIWWRFQFNYEQWRYVFFYSSMTSKPIDATVFFLAGAFVIVRCIV